MIHVHEQKKIVSSKNVVQTGWKALGETAEKKLGKTSKTFEARLG